MPSVSINKVAEEGCTMCRKPTCHPSSLLFDIDLPWWCSPGRGQARALLNISRAVRIAASKSCDHMVTPPPLIEIFLRQTHIEYPRMTHTSV
jgi:hypothetical protein